MLGAAKYAIANLLNFAGRDARQTFWYWVLVVYIAMTAVMFLAMIPAFTSMFGGMFDMAREDPTDQAAMNAVMADSMSEMMRSTMWFSFAAAIVSVVALGASTARRAHDSGLSAWWALFPALLQAIALIQVPGQIDEMTAAISAGRTDATSPLASLQMGAAGWLPWIALIFIGVRKSTPGPNRFGDAAVQF